MESDTPFADGESPDGSPHEEFGDAGGLDPWTEFLAEERQRGWIPPEDRLWLHPSEMGRGRATPAPGRPHHNGRQRVLATAAVGTVAVTAAVLSVVFLSASNSSAPGIAVQRVSETSLTTPSPSATSVRATNRVDSAMAELTRSVVELLGSHGTWEATAVVMPGGLAVTSSAAEPSTGSVWAVGPDGRRRL